MGFVEDYKELRGIVWPGEKIGHEWDIEKYFCRNEHRRFFFSAGKADAEKKWMMLRIGITFCGGVFVIGYTRFFLLFCFYSYII